MKKTILTTIFIVSLFFVFSFTADAATYYVTSSGSSGGDGSFGNPWQTFGSINWGSIQPGDTLMLIGKNYYIFQPHCLFNSL